MKIEQVYLFFMDIFKILKKSLDDMREMVKEKGAVVVTENDEYLVLKNKLGMEFRIKGERGQ